MDLPVLPPVKPMLAKAATKLPVGDGLYYEPKWDGFRCIVFRDGDEVELGSRNERPLTRYFPEVVAAVKANLPERCVVDGEIVVPARRPAALRGPAPAHPPGRVAGQPARRADPGVVRRLRPARPRRRVAAGDAVRASGGPGCETALAGVQAAGLRHRASPRTPTTAQRWFDTFEGAGLDGVVAKAADLPYGPDQRLMTKVKHVRTADCVVAGFRWHKSGPIVGSLLLGLYNDAGDLQHIGVAASFPMARRAELVEELAPYRANAARGAPLAGLGERPGERRTGGEHRDARRGQPVEREEGPLVGAAAARNWSWRSSTTSSKGVDFVTPGSSSGGVPTGTR